MIRIDGGHGEGGGQILRTSLVFSFVLGEEIEVHSIRVKRGNPGLRPQHLATLNAFASATGGLVENARVGSDMIRFSPGKAAKGRMEIDVGTAGSITLIMQTLLPAFSLKGLISEVQVRGGTDTKWCPTYDYLHRIFEPAALALGVPISTTLKKRGYYPAGGGLVVGKCLPAKTVGYVKLDRRPNQSRARISSVCANLPEEVASRQAESAARAIRAAGVTVEYSSVQRIEADSPGTSILVDHVEEGGVFLGGDAVGEKGVKAEVVGATAAEGFVSAFTKGAAVDRHLADMLVPLMALQQGGEMVTDEDTEHLRTNLDVAATFTGCQFDITKEGVLTRVRIMRQQEG